MKALLRCLLVISAACCFTAAEAQTSNSQTVLANGGPALSLANAVFKNMAAINNSLTKAGFAPDTVSFHDGTESVSSGQTQFSINLSECGHLPPPNTNGCRMIGTLLITTSSRYTPGGAFSNTKVSFQPN